MTVVVALVMWNGDVASSLLRLVAVAGLGCVVVLAAFGLWRHTEAETATLLVVVTAGGVAMDQYFGRASLLNPRIEQARALGVPFDARWAADVAVDERAAGRNVPPVYPTITAANFHLRPLAAVGGAVVPFATVASARNVLCNEGGRYEIVNTDRHGFVNPDRMWDGARAWDMVVVGDSFAEGWCVSSGQSFADRLRERFGRVLNLGRGSLGPLGELGVTREYLRGAEARVVVWSFFEGNDWADLASELAVPQLAGYLDPAFSQHLLERRDAVQSALSTYAEDYLAGYRWRKMLPFGRWRATLGDMDPQRLLRPSRLPVVSDGAGQDSGGLGKKETQEGDDMALLRRVIQLELEEIRATGARPVFVLLPSFDTYPQPGAVAVARRQFLANVMKEINVTMVDGDAAFRAAAADPRDFFALRTWGHYTAEGHRVVADAIAQAVETEQ